MAAVITVAIVDDDRMLVEGFRSWIGGVADLRLVAVAATVDGLVAQGVVAEVALLDLHLRDGSEAADNVERIGRTGSRVLVVSVWTQPCHAAVVYSAGAWGYLTKDHDLDALGAAIRDVAGGTMTFSPELADALLRDVRPQRPELSGQERAVLEAYASGMTLRSAARHLGIAAETAHTYLKRVKAKYHLVGRAAQTKLDLADRVREDAEECPYCGGVHVTGPGA